MYRTKYVVAGKWTNNENNKDTFPITAENIKILVRDSNYEKENLTKGMLRLMLDKNFMDKLIMLANNASIFLYCEKVLYDQNNQPISSTPVQTDWSGEYTYVASSDINYNKEIDYMGDNSQDKKDVYKEIMLGIFFKAANERNNCTENRVIRETSIQNTIIKSMDSMPLLIEPFDYNNVIDQLAIPPQESLVKFIDFMNQYKVFYETPYRFFIDAKCTYLLSSSGQATECKDEKYSSVYFDIFSLVQTGGFIEGMEEDDTNKRYVVPILVKDTNYIMDKTRSKYMSEIEAIMDPAKENSILNATELNKQLEQIKQYTEGINNKIKAKVPDLKKISIDIRNIEITTIGATDDVKEALEALSEKVELAKAEINKVATPKSGEKDSFDDPSGSTRKLTTTGSGSGSGGSGSGGQPVPQYFTMNGSRKQQYFDLLTNSLAAAQYQGNEFYKAKAAISKCTNTTVESLMHTAYIPSAVNGVSLINVFENKNLLSAFSGAAKSFCSTNKQQIGELFPLLGNGQNSQASASAILNAINEIRNAKIAFMSQCPNATDDGTDFQSIIDGIAPLINKIESAIGAAGNGFNLYDVIPGIVGKAVESVSGEINKINKLTTQVSNILTEFQASWQAIGDKINSNIAGVMKGLSNAGGIVDSLSSLKFGSLEDIFNSINKIKDISQLGRVGLSCFDLKLDGSGNGKSVVKVDNDNYNILKNIKASIENKDNRIVLNKLDLDAEVFTPNKEFIIHNYNAHNDKDGFFILQRKVEIYIREDKEFNCTTMLEFDKVKTEPKDVAEKAGTTAEQTTKAKMEQSGQKNVSIDDIIRNGRDIINTVKSNGISIDSIIKVAGNAKQIESSIRKMGSKQGASPNLKIGNKNPFILH